MCVFNHMLKLLPVTVIFVQTAKNVNFYLCFVQCEFLLTYFELCFVFHCQTSVGSRSTVEILRKEFSSPRSRKSSGSRKLFLLVRKPESILYQ